MHIFSAFSGSQCNQWFSWSKYLKFSMCSVSHGLLSNGLSPDLWGRCFWCGGPALLYAMNLTTDTEVPPMLPVMSEPTGTSLERIQKSSGIEFGIE